MNESMGDIVAEGIASLRSRWTRTLLTSAGIALGVGALLAATALSSSAAASIKGRLELVTVSTVTVRLDVTGRDDILRVMRRAEENLYTLDGVRGVGGSIDLSDVVYSVSSGIESEQHEISVLAVTEGFVDAVDTDAKADIQPLRSGLIAGSQSRRYLGLPMSARDGQTVFVGGRPFMYAGAITRDVLDSRLDGAVAVPLVSANEFGWLGSADEVIIVVRTTPGIAAGLAKTVALATWPEQPQRVSVSVGADPRELREGVQSDTVLLVSGLSVLLIVSGLFSIANSMLTSVLERVAEVGLRRALGASRSVVAAMTLVESSAIGLFGGVAGSVTGISVGAVVAVARGWPPVIPIALSLCAPLLGALIGGLAGAYPAFRAARVDPAVTLRGSK